MRKREEKILDVDASMQGNMIFKDPVNLRINGTFEGALDIKGILTIGENAVVKATIKGETVIVAGRVDGDIEASKSLKLVPPGRITGDIKTPSLSISEGAVFEGQCSMGRSKERVMPDKNILTVDDVARYLEVDASLILNWAREGKLPGTKEKDTWRFERAKLDTWIASEKIR